MLVDSDSFISVEKKLIKQGKLQKFEKENGPVTSLMMISKGKIADDMRYQLVENLAHHPLHIVYKASFDQYDETLNCIFDRQTKSQSQVYGTRRKEETLLNRLRKWSSFYQ